MSNTSLSDNKTIISCDEALRIARLDAECAYRDLSGYRISVSLENGRWLVDYELNQPQMQGGGPHYAIDAQTGEILSRRYDQ